MWHQKFEKNGKPRLIYNSELRKEIGGVCASEANSQLSCVLEAVDAATEVDTYQRLSRDHSLLDHLPGGSLPLPSGVSHELSYLLVLTQTSMHSAHIGWEKQGSTLNE